MKFPERMYPHLSRLEQMEFGELKQNSWLFRRDYKHELWKEYRSRMDFIEYRELKLGGDKGVHKMNGHG